MPINIPMDLPAYTELQNENIFVMDSERAFHQDIRPLKIVILNLMPTKIVTETQLMRLIGNSPLQVDAVLLQTKSYVSKNTPREHMNNFYVTFDDIRNKKFDGLIITGAPVEHMEFEQVEYWDELCEIMEWSKKNVYSTLHICWGAVAGLNYHYNIEKKVYDEKIFGIFKHRVLKQHIMLCRGFDDEFYAPHSRFCGIDREDIEKRPELEIICESDEAGIYIVSAKHGRQLFVTGHSEYDEDTLASEYFRDVELGHNIQIPKNYFIDDDPKKGIRVSWRGHANLLFCNWLNYYVYQQTPYEINEIKDENDE